MKYPPTPPRGTCCILGSPKTPVVEGRRCWKCVNVACHEHCCVWNCWPRCAGDVHLCTFIVCEESWCMQEPWSCGVGVHVRYMCLANLGLLELAICFIPVHSGKWDTPVLQTGCCAHVFAEPASSPSPSNANPTPSSQGLS